MFSSPILGFSIVINLQMTSSELFQSRMCIKIFVLRNYHFYQLYSIPFYSIFKVKFLVQFSKSSRALAGHLESYDFQIPYFLFQKTF